jgi:hypothetical protein
MAVTLGGAGVGEGAGAGVAADEIGAPVLDGVAAGVAAGWEDDALVFGEGAPVVDEGIVAGFELLPCALTTPAVTSRHTTGTTRRNSRAVAVLCFIAGASICWF